MKTYKPFNEKQPKNQLPPKLIRNLQASFRHRDRGIHVGKVKGS